MTLPDRILLARALLDAVTPLKGDCGRRCGAACCQPDEDGKGGMLLFPGEERLYDPLPAWATLSDSGLRLDGAPLWFFTCEGACDRADRPLACRIFPLTPQAGPDGDALSVCLDVRAWPVCPLMPHGTQGLSGAFLAAVQAAMALVWEDETGRAYIQLLTGLLDAFRGGGL